MEDYEEKIKEIVKEEFGGTVLGIKRIAEGFSHHMYDVKIDKSPFDVIFRFQNAPSEDTNVLKEKWVMDKLAEKGIPVPKIHKFFFDEEAETGFMVLEKVRGIRLDTIWHDLSEEDKISLAGKMGKLAKNIHAIKLPRFGYIQDYGKIISEEKGYTFKKEDGNKVYNRFVREWLGAHIKEVARMWSIISLDKEIREISLDYLHYILSNSYKFKYKGEPVLVHGDFIFGHIFVEKVDREFKISGIIDFEFAMAHDPEFEFLKFHRAGFFNDKRIKSAFEKGYGKPINEDNVLFYRLNRDFAFARVLMDSGDKEKALEVLRFIKEKISATSK